MRVPLGPVALAGGAVAVVAMAAASWATARQLTFGAVGDEARERLGVSAALAVAQLRASQGLPLDSVASALAVASGYRVTIFDPEMRALADSDMGSGVADALSDRQLRSEVADALLHAAGTSLRRSAMNGRSYIFSAARGHWRGELAVIRLGDPIAPIAAAATRTAHTVAAVVLAVGGAAVLLLHRLLGSGTRFLGEVAGLLQRLAAGRPPGPRLRSPGVTDLARLASAANRVRFELEEQVARVSRERDELAHLMDEVGEGLMALTDDARILRINPAARALLGLGEVVPFAPVGSVVRDPVLRDLLEASVVRDGGRLEVAVGERELEVRTKMGAEGGAVVLLVDITELRRLEAVRADFVANASHELKTPLTVIRAAAETVQEEELPPDLREKFLASIEDSTLRLQRLVDDLLDLSRYESGAWRPEAKPFPLEVVAWSAWEEHEARAAARGVAFEVIGEGVALGDEAAVYQIFRNLYENSLRYVADARGRIAVQISAGQGVQRVTVSDNGSGIPASALPRVFERFYRVDTARSREEGGTGLGLAIVRHLVSSMGGEVTAESQWGEGTTIVFTIPGGTWVRARLATA